MNDLPLTEPTPPQPPQRVARKPNGGATKATAAPALPAEYARLDLLAPVKLPDGDVSREVVVYRPTCRIMCDVLDTIKNAVQIERFVRGCCRAVKSDDQPVQFGPGELCSIDGAELASILGSMSDDAEQVHIEDMCDGVTTPILYTLQRPIKMRPEEDAETVHQFEFQARKVGDVAEFLDARSETTSFHTFMRLFAKPLGLQIPMMSDALINSLDFLDYLVIRRQIMGKFTTPQKRWKPASSNGP